jgi:hypothetical protein
MRRLARFFPTLSLLAGCASSPPAPPAPAPDMPEPIYTEMWLAPSRGIAALRPAAVEQVEHVMGLDGQRCEWVDLRLRCRMPGTAGPVPAANAESPANKP